MAASLAAAEVTYLALMKCTYTPQDMWPCGLYNSDTKDTNNPMRCIMGDASLKYKYFETMSKVYAEICGGTAVLITADVSNIPLNGIWGRIELPTLQRDTDFDSPKQQVSNVSKPLPNQTNLSYPAFFRSIELHVLTMLSSHHRSEQKNQMALTE